MMNLEDVPDMNVGDMVNECTSQVNASYTTHAADTVIPYMTRYYNLCTTGYYNLCTTVYYNLCQVFDALNLTV
jgi:hypothetical protein